MSARNDLLLALSVTWLALSPGLVSAQPSEAQIDAVKQNCRSDFISNCRSVKPGGPEAIQCLKEKATSPACKAALSALSAPAQATPAAPAQPAPPPPAAHTPAAPAPGSTPAPAEKPAATKPAAAPKPAAPKPAESKPAAPKPAVAATPPSPPAPATTLTPTSKPTLQELRLVRQTCFTDIQVQCPGVPVGEGRILTCLAAKEPALSPGCRQTMLKLNR